MFSEFKKTIKLAIPAMLGQLGGMMMGFTDSIMVGKIGAVSLAASSFVNAVWAVPFVFLVGITTAITVNTSQNLGAGKIEEIGKNFLNALFITFLITLVFMAGMLLLTPYLSIFKQPLEVTEAAKSYYVIIMWSFIPVWLFQCLKQFADGLGHTVPATICLFIGLVLNIILNYMFIYGKWGAPEWGLYGAGVATMISRIIIVLILLGYVLKSKKYKPYLPQWEWPSFKYIENTLRIGIPSGFQYLFEVGAFAGSGIMMGWVGTNELAAHQISLNLASMTFMIALGMSIASSVRVGNAYGSKNFRKLKIIGQGSLFFSGLVSLLFAILFIIFRYYLPTWYISNNSVIVIAAKLLIIAGFFQLFDAIQCVCMGILRGMSDVVVPTAVSFISYWIVGLPLAYVLGFILNMRETGIWIALSLSLVFSSTLLSIRFYLLSNRIIDPT